MDMETAAPSRVLMLKASPGASTFWVRIAYVFRMIFCDTTGHEVITRPGISKEFVILVQAGDHVQTDFSKPGDPGSVLTNRFGRLYGLLYGPTYAYAGINPTAYAGIAMIMSEFYETIEAKIYSNDRYTIPELI